VKFWRPWNLWWVERLFSGNGIPRRQGASKGEGLSKNERQQMPEIVPYDKSTGVEGCGRGQAWPQEAKQFYSSANPVSAPVEIAQTVEPLDHQGQAEVGVGGI